MRVAFDARVLDDRGLREGGIGRYAACLLDALEPTPEGDELVRLDFLYLERWSVGLDLAIILKTVPAVVRARGAW